MKLLAESPRPDALASGVELAQALRRRELTVSELIEDHLRRIFALDGDLHCYLQIDATRVRAAARELDAELAQGRDRGPLHGLPVAIKDTIDVEGYATTAASHALSRARAARDAVLVARLKASGAVVIGKANTWELGCGVGEFQTRAAAPEARHPLHPSRFAGGSSNGSAVAVASGLAVIAVGGDTGGSIRSPAAACGIVGLKPTLGLVPLDGVLTHSVTLDHVGPLARTVEDARNALLAMAGSSAPIGHGSKINFARPRVGIPFELTQIAPSLDPGVAQSFDAMLRRMREIGLAVREVKTGTALSHWRETLSVIASWESAKANGALLEAGGDLLSPSVREWLLQSSRIEAAAYRAAMNERSEMVERLNQIWLEVDVLVLPSAFHAVPSADDEAARIRYSLESPNAIFNMSGHPAVSIPIGSDREGYPVAIQAAMPLGRDLDLLEFAAAWSN